MKKKKYVNAVDIKCPNFMQNHFKVGCKVIVTDGSYMVNADKTKKEVYGTDFKLVTPTLAVKHELLTVTRVNIPFRTNYDPLNINDTLGYHNNCEIEGGDGEKYYCSKINIVRYE